MLLTAIECPIDKPLLVKKSQFQLFSERQSVSCRGVSSSFPSATRACIDYSVQGLPIVAIFHGFEHSLKKHASLFKFVNSNIIDELQQLVPLISQSSTGKDTEILFYKFLNTLRYSWNSLTSTDEAVPAFEFSIALTFQSESTKNLYCLGFGVGATGIIYKPIQSNLQQLVDTIPSKKVNVTEWWLNNCLDNCTELKISPVAPETQILAYSYICDPDNKLLLKKDDSLILDSNFVEAQENIFDKLSKAVTENFKRCKNEYEVITNGKMKFGKDAILAQVSIPDAEKQSVIQFLYHLELFLDYEIKVLGNCEKREKFINFKHQINASMDRSDSNALLTSVRREAEVHRSNNILSRMGVFATSSSKVLAEFFTKENELRKPTI